MLHTSASSNSHRNAGLSQLAHRRIASPAPEPEALVMSLIGLAFVASLVARRRGKKRP